MNYLIILTFMSALGALLAGCSTTASYTKSYAPDGKPSYEISCSNLAGSLSQCYQKAGEICKSKGYIVISSHEGALATIIAECKE